jgi:hypothetical protein
LSAQIGVAIAYNEKMATVKRAGKLEKAMRFPPRLEFFFIETSLLIQKKQNFSMPHNGADD